jgi:dolichyl-phosphate-mannose-protein mannosyltransferase
MRLLGRLATAGLLAVMAGLLVLSSLHKPLAYDEIFNLDYGYRFLREGPEADPRGQRMPVLALNASPCRFKQCRLSYVNRTELRRLATRAASIVATLLLGLVVYRWAGELFGAGAALVSLGLYVFNPSFLAHGKQVTSDVAVSLFATGTLYFFWRLTRRFRWSDYAAATLCLAAALVSKYTALVLLPVLALLLFGRAAGEALRGTLTRSRLARGLGLAALSTLLVGAAINLVYELDGSFRPAAEHTWKSRALAGLAAAAWPVPLPRVYAQGIDWSFFVEEHPQVARGPNYLLGSLDYEGRWYAFPLMLALKTPLAFFGLLGWALAGRLRRDRAWDMAVLLVPSLVLLAWFSLFVGAQIGIRYLLPALPPLIVVAGGAWGIGAGRRGRIVLAALLAWHTASTLSYHPHYVSYFNELIGPRLDAYRYLADSNLDWEDLGYFVSRFREEHPELDCTVDPGGPRAGCVLVSANRLLGLFGSEQYRWLRENFRPVGHVGYAYLRFEVPADELAAVLEKARASP